MRIPLQAVQRLLRLSASNVASVQVLLFLAAVTLLALQATGEPLQ